MKKVGGVDYIQINEAGRKHKGFVKETKKFIDNNDAPLKIARNTYYIAILTIGILITQIGFEYAQCVKESRREYREELEKQLRLQEYIDRKSQFLLQDSPKRDTTDR